MSWSWRTPIQAAQRAAAREAHFVAIAREAHDRARGHLGPQRLKPRDWEFGFGCLADPPRDVQDDKGDVRRPQAYRGSAAGRLRS
jgi:hypothetical protein